MDIQPVTAVNQVIQPSKLIPQEQRLWPTRETDTPDSFEIPLDYSSKHSEDPEDKVEIGTEAMALQDSQPKTIADMKTRTVFKMDDASGRMLMQVVDSVTQEVIRQVPPEELLKLSNMIQQYLGMMVDKRN